MATFVQFVTKSLTKYIGHKFIAVTSVEEPNKKEKPTLRLIQQ
jgi:hypothetical protein